MTLTFFIFNHLTNQAVLNVDSPRMTGWGKFPCQSVMITTLKNDYHLIMSPASFAISKYVECWGNHQTPRPGLESTAFLPDLCDDQTVKRIFVMKGQQSHNVQMFWSDMQQPHCIAFNMLTDHFWEDDIQLQLADAGLDRHFPQTGHAHQPFISGIFNQLPRMTA